MPCFTLYDMKGTHELTNSVRKLRRAADMTQEDLADRAGVSRQTILAIEKGNYTPSVGLALMLAAVLKVRVEDLFQLSPGQLNEGGQSLTQIPEGGTS